LSFFIEDRKKKNSDKPVNLEMDAVKQTKRAQRLAREKRITDTAAASGLYSAAQSSDKSGAWSTASSGTPVSDMINASKAVWTNSSGYKANRVVVPMDVAMVAIQTDEWKDYFKYTDSSKKDLFDFITGVRNIGLEPKIAGSFGLSTYENTASDPAGESLWGENVLVFYGENSPTLQSRTFMYSPFMEYDQVRRYRINGERGENIEIYEDIDELVVDRNCAYLIYNTLA
jgi:hypothetical protein